MPDTMPLVAVVSALLGLVFFLSGLVALTKRRLFRMTVRLTVALLLLAVAGLLGVLAFATQGYSALTREGVAALGRVEPAGPGAAGGSVPSAPALFPVEPAAGRGVRLGDLRGGGRGCGIRDPGLDHGAHGTQAASQGELAPSAAEPARGLSADSAGAARSAARPRGAWRCRRRGARSLR